jgi:hypothetical protein
MTSQVSITLQRPKDYLNKVDSIKDSDIGDTYSGLPYTRGDLLHLLKYKLPQIPIKWVEGVGAHPYIQIFSYELEESQLNELNDFLSELESPVQYKVIENKTICDEILKKEKDKEIKLKGDEKYQKIVQSLDNPVINSFPAKDRSLECEIKDETFWFDNVGKIFHGELSIKNIIPINKNDISCYIDYSFSKNINIRNGVLLYDKIYVNLPIEKTKSYFFETQKMKENEFYELIEKNKLHIIFTQPSERYDQNFINEIYNVNPNAVISRRRVSSIVLANLVNLTSNNFINQLDMMHLIPDMAELISEITKIDKKYIYKMLVWPFSALRQSFSLLTFNSTKSLGTIGVNTAIEDQIIDILKKDLKLEFMTSSEDIHISHALKSVYYPSSLGNNYSLSPFSSILGNLLNFYANSTAESLTNYIDTKRNILALQRPNSPLELFDVNEYLSIHEIENISQELRTSEKINSVFNYLADLSEDERKSKINEYNILIAKIKKQESKKIFLDLGISASTDLMSTLLGTIFPPIGFIGSASQLLKIAAKKIKKIKRAEAVIEKIDLINKLRNTDKKNISYLYKINSVAKLKENY